VPKRDWPFTVEELQIALQRESVSAHTGYQTESCDFAVRPPVPMGFLQHHGSEKEGVFSFAGMPALSGSV
jgi:hypothetical protein